MTWTSTDSWILFNTLLVIINCVLPGVFLVLRKNSLLGDGISHAVLPGIAFAFLLTGTRNSIFLFLGAVAAGLLLAFLIEFLQKHLALEKNAILGAVFTLLFATGLVLIEQGARNVDLDPSCVLFGAVEISPLARISIGAIKIPEASIRLMLLLLLNTTLLLLFYKELNIMSFDPMLAKSLGYRITLANYLFIIDVAITAVSVFEIAGSIQTVAFLTIPAATASLFTKHVRNTILMAIFFGILAAIGGYMIAVVIPLNIGVPDTNVGGGTSIMAGIILFIVIFLTKGLKKPNVVR